jgi:hypothetical protein
MDLLDRLSATFSTGLKSRYDSNLGWSATLEALLSAELLFEKKALIPALKQFLTTCL